jgi:hypothetical protein
MLTSEHTNELLYAPSTLIKTALLLGIASVGLVPSALAADGQTDSYLAVWASDKETDDNHLDPDFLAIIDADPRSPTYGKVVNTAALESVPNANLLDELGLASGVASDALNEAHHMNHDPITVYGRQYLFPGGLMSANLFRCDVTDPLHIPTCPLIVTSTQVHKFAGVDDVVQLPNGHLAVTYLGAKDLTTPGGLVEIDVEGNVIQEYDAAQPGGPVRYVPSVKGVTDTGLLAHPHGLGLRPDLGLVVTSDYADPTSVAANTVPWNPNQDFGTTVRVWDISHLDAGPQKIIQMPAGPRIEPNPVEKEPEGLMALGLTNLHLHKGAFTASMLGGTLFYSPDISAPSPTFREVYDVGPGTGASLFIVTPDDRYLVLPVSGVLSPGDPEYNRDYPGEHSRRLIALDIRRLLAAGPHVECDAPRVVLGPDGYTVGITGHNSAAPDCPVETGSLNLDSDSNFASHGGPHSLAIDHESRRVAVSNYFLQLTPFGLPGTMSAGDDRVCMAWLTPAGELAFDARFKDELTGQPCVAFDRPTSYSWPNRGSTGAAKPHAMAFINLSSNEKE